jgi:hypothetical protein
MKKIINICNLYILIWCLYFLHWYATGQVPILEGLSNVFLGINMLISLYSTLAVIRKYPMNSLMKVILLVLAVFIVYGLLYIMGGDVIFFGGKRINPGTYLVAPLRTFLPIITFFFFTKLGLLTEEVIRWWMIPFILLSVYCFYAAQFVRYGEEAEDLFTNGTGYLFASLFPFVYFFRSRAIYQYLIIGIIIFFAVLAVKRGALLVTFVCLLYFVYEKMRFSKMSKRIGTLVLLTIVLLSVWYVSRDTLLNSDAFQRRVEDTLEGNDSNRSNLRHIQLTAYSSGTLFQLLFGFGADGSLRISPNYAHNDWIEVLVDQGLFGFIIYFSFWATFFITWRRSKRNRQVYNILGMIFLSGLIRTAFSMWYSNSNMFVSLPFGYCLALISSHQNYKTE